MSPIHINYLSDEGAAGGCEIDARNNVNWRNAAILKNATRAHHNAIQRNSFVLPTDYLDESDERNLNFIVPDPIYAELPREEFSDVPPNALMDAESMSSLSSVPNGSINRRRRNIKYREKDNQKSTYSVENEAFLMQDIMDVSTGTKRKIRYQDMPSNSSASSSQCSSRKESQGGWN